MRLALLLNAIDHRIGGVLIRGEKGTAKSTMARSLAALLPEQPVVADCPYGCDPENPAEQDAEHRGVPGLPARTRRMPVIELPINATEDRIAGTLDVRAALTEGAYRFQPGLLAAANRGILYVDEVNLLPDHLVDLVLDAAAMGRNSVEREGVSIVHPARFILVGTMNPEEGDLRPQLLDRFGLCVDVAGLTDVDQRIEVMRRRTAFETDPLGFAADWQDAQQALRGQVTNARRVLPDVHVPEEILRLIAGTALAMGVDGHRADLVILRAASALAALDGRQDVTRDDVRRAAELALVHRVRRRPFDQQSFTDERLQQAMDRAEGPAGGEEAGADEPQDPATAEGHPPVRPPELPPPPPQRLNDTLSLPSIDLGRDRTPRSGSGRRRPAPSSDEGGRTVRTVAGDTSNDIAFGASVRAAAVRTAREEPGRSLSIQPDDLQTRVRTRRVGARIIFIVDASGSMGAKQRMEAARGAALTLLTEAYQRRDRVALIAFRGATAETLLPPTDSVELVQQRLAELAVGGRTPLADGLRAGLDLIRQLRIKDSRALCIPVLLTDGRANAGSGDLSPIEEALQVAGEFRQPGVYPLVLDTERETLVLGLAAAIAERAGARYVCLADLTAETVAASVRDVAAEAE
jgi:magnesium chelatase subunit D